MSIETFIQEIESRKKSDMSTLEKELNEKKSEIEDKKNTAIQELKDNYDKEAKYRLKRS